METHGRRRCFGCTHGMRGKLLLFFAVYTAVYTVFLYGKVVILCGIKMMPEPIGFLNVCI